VIAYKFLDPGAVGPFTGFRWPTPNGGSGEWVEAETIEPCRGGVHACRVRDLPVWLGRELWEIELDGDIRELDRKLVAARGRLVRQVTPWDDAARDAFARFCLRSTRLRVGAIPVVSGFVGDIERFRAQGRVAIAGFAAARAAELLGGPAAYDAERAAQAEWLAAHLGLEF